MANESEMIREAAIDPGWTVGVMTMGQIKIPMVTLDHPRHGRLSMILPVEVARQVAALLNDAANDAEAPIAVRPSQH